MRDSHRQDDEIDDWTERAIPPIPIPRPRPREESQTGGAASEPSAIPHQRSNED